MKLDLLEGDLVRYIIWNSSLRKRHPFSPIYLHLYGLMFLFGNSSAHEATVP